MQLRNPILVLSLALFSSLSGVILWSGTAHAEKPSGTSRSKSLSDLVMERDAAFSWEVKHEGEIAGCKYVQVHFVSQRWRGVAWRHSLFVILPPNVAPETKHALMLIDGGSWREEWGDAGPGPLPLPQEAQLMATIAKEVGSPTAIVRQTPFQPMLNGRREDALIAETFKRFFETGDYDWPLLPVMARAASAAMDATTEIANDRWQLKLDSFTVTGASKRGWTTYLLAACDSRVKAIAPMVIDMLNLGPQMKHQLDAWGEYSPQIEDYTRLGLQKVLGTRPGDTLMQLVDPFVHARTLRMPKIVILGTNDAYWPVDASQFYFDQLPEPRGILNIPNNGHGLTDLGRVVGSISALHRSVVNEKPLPAFKGTVRTNEESCTIEAEADEEPSRVYYWIAHSPNRDFRRAKWTARKAEGRGVKTWDMELKAEETGYVAGMIEAQFDLGALFPLSLTTEVRVVPAMEDN